MNQGSRASDSTEGRSTSVDARAASKSLFGNSDRAAVAAAVARSSDGWVNATDLHAAMPQVAVNRIRAQLVALVDVGLMDMAPSGDDRKIWYIRREHQFWAACVDLEAAWTAGRRPGTEALG